jgi:hypothetical protein
MARLVGLVGLCFLAPSLGIRKRKGVVESNSTLEVVSGQADCDALEGIVVNGKDFTDAAQIICKLWPAGAGEFPVNDVNRVRELVKKAMGPGGTWDLIKEIRENHNGKPFCWRNETLRNVVSNNCEMESNGVCYGKCAYGFKPASLTGRFRPVCSSVCGATDFPVSCGFGCSSTRLSCATTLFNQVSSVAQGVGRVVEFVSGDDRIVKVIDGVLTFSEFLIGVLPSLIDAVKKGIDIVTDAESGAMALILLFKYIQEIAPEIGETVQSIKEAFEELADIIGSLAQERINTGSISVSSVVREILEHGDRILDYTVKLTKAFSFGRCAVATRDVAFTVEEVGEEAFSGPYIQQGTKNGHPYYHQQLNTGVAVEYRSAGWAMSQVGYLYNSVRYQSSETGFDYPVEGWYASSNSVERPTPDVVEVRERQAGR